MKLTYWGLALRALFTGMFVFGSVVPQAAAQTPQAQPSPTAFPVTDDLPSEAAAALRQALQAGAVATATPLKASQDAPAEQAPGAPVQSAPASAAPAAPFPGGPVSMPGATYQVLTGKKRTPGTDAAPKEEPLPAWANEVFNQQKKMEAQQQAPVPAQEGPAVPADGQPKRKPTRLTPPSVPADLPAPRHATLVEAVKAGDLRDAENHILRGANLDGPGAGGHTPVTAAAEAGDLAMLALLLEYGANPRLTSPGTDIIPVVAAAERGHFACVQLLVDFGAQFLPQQAALYGDLRFLTKVVEQAPDLVLEQDPLRNTLAHHAAYGNEPAVIAFLAQWGADLTAVNLSRDTPMSAAALLNHKQTVQALVDHGVDINGRLSAGETVLHRKARKGDTELVEFLLSLGADVNARDQQGCTPLHAAAMANKAQFIEFLLDHGAALEAADDNGATALHAAARAGSLGAITTLSRRGAAIGAVDGEGATPLFAAAQSGKLKAFTALLDLGADLKAVNVTGATVVHAVVSGAGAAAAGGDEVAGISDELDQRLRLLKLCFTKGMSAATVDATGTSALHLAAQNGQTVLAEALAEQGAPVNAADSTGRTALMCAFEAGHSGTGKALLAYGAELSRVDGSGRTVLHTAAQTKDPDLVRDLISAGADVRALDQNGRSVLHCAAQKGSLEVARMLLALGAPLNAADVAGRVALHLAAERGDVGMVKVLVANGADVSAQDLRGRQALHAAAGANQPEAAAALLSAGADVDALDKEGLSPLRVATEMQHRDVVTVMSRYRARVKSPAPGVAAAASSAPAAGSRQPRLNPTSGNKEFEQAVKHGDLDAADTLLKTNRALVNVRLGDETALQAACRAGNKAMAELLLAYGANVSLGEQGGQRMLPLHAAADGGHVEIVKMLLVMGANPRAVDGEGRAAADLASGKGHAEATAVLRSYEEKHSGGERPGRRSLFSLIAAGDVDGLRGLLDEFPGLFSAGFLNKAPYQLAVTMNKKDILVLLLERGADPKMAIEPAAGRTALHEAANRGHTDMVEALLKAGADSQARDKLNQTPLDLARQNHFEDVVKLLQQRAPQETQ